MKIIPRSKSVATALFTPIVALLAPMLVAGSPNAAVSQTEDRTTAASVAAYIQNVRPGQSETVVIDDETTMTIRVGEAEVARVADIQNDRTLSRNERAELLLAAPFATVRSARWSQFTTGAAYTQTQNGKFYWNGSRVWVTQSYSGYRGEQRCFTNYAITGWAIHGTSISDTGGSSARNLYCGWNVTQPAWFTHYVSMTATVYSNGSISGFGSTTS